MPRAATTHIHVLNLCVQHKTDPEIAIVLLALQAFADVDMAGLTLWTTVADMPRAIVAYVRANAPLWMAPPKDMAEVNRLTRTLPFELGSRTP